MGMYDNVVLLDEPLACPAGHPLGDLQTKSFCDPSMSTYLIREDPWFARRAAAGATRVTRTSGLPGVSPATRLSTKHGIGWSAYHRRPRCASTPIALIVSRSWFGPTERAFGETSFRNTAFSSNSRFSSRKVNR